MDECCHRPPGHSCFRRRNRRTARSDRPLPRDRKASGKNAVGEECLQSDLVPTPLNSWTITPRAPSPRSAEARLRPAAAGLTARGRNVHSPIPAHSPTFPASLHHWAQLLSSPRVKPRPSRAESSLRTPGLHHPLHTLQHRHPSPSAKGVTPSPRPPHPQ